MSWKEYFIHNKHFVIMLVILIGLVTGILEKIILDVIFFNIWFVCQLYYVIVN